jgi:hypothetical protein
MVLMSRSGVLLAVVMFLWVCLFPSSGKSEGIYRYQIYRDLDLNGFVVSDAEVSQGKATLVLACAKSFGGRLTKMSHGDINSEWRKRHLFVGRCESYKPLDLEKGQTYQIFVADEGRFGEFQSSKERAEMRQELEAQCKSVYHGKLWRAEPVSIVRDDPFGPFLYVGFCTVQ